jgi:hypothetical protein
LARWIRPFAFVLAATGVAHGHHSIAGVYDARQQVTIEGVVMEFQFVAPHPFLSVNVARDRGAEPWRLDMDDRNEMREIRMEAATFRPGDRIVVTGSLARREPRRLYIQRLARPSDGFSYEQVRSRPRLRQASR